VSNYNEIVNKGRPFIEAKYLGVDIAEQMCKVKGNALVKENRVMRKHTLKNKHGIHVFTEFMPPGSVVERDARGDIVRVLDDKGVLVVQSVPDGAQDRVTLTQYFRGGVGFKVSGQLEVLG